MAESREQKEKSREATRGEGAPQAERLERGEGTRD